MPWQLVLLWAAVAANVATAVVIAYLATSADADGDSIDSHRRQMRALDPAARR